MIHHHPVSRIWRTHGSGQHTLPQTNKKLERQVFDYSLQVHHSYWKDIAIGRLTMN